MVIPEYAFRKNFNPTAGKSCSVPKDEFIQMNKDTILKMDKQIKLLENEIKKSVNPKNREYENLEKRLSVCRRIKQDCEASVRLTKMHMEIIARTKIK